LRISLTRCRTRTPVGLDLGASGWRAAQLVRQGVRVGLRAAVARTRSIENSDTAADSTSSALERSLRAAPFRGRDVSCVLDPPAIEFFSLELPAAVLSDPELQHSDRGAEADLAEMTRWEVERMVGASAVGIEARHWALPPSTVPGPNAIAVAAKRSEVLRLVELCHQAGWTCNRVDAGAAALARFGSLLNRWNGEQVWGLLDVGFNESRVVLCVNDTPVLVRRAGSGGGAWTERVAEALQVSVKAAEIHKRDHGIALAGRGVRREAPGMNAGAQGEAPSSELAPILLGALRTELREMASEIKRSYEYVLSRYPARHAADLVLVGNGSTLKNLPEFMSGALGIVVRRASDYLGQDGCRLRVCPCRVGSGTCDKHRTLLTEQWHTNIESLAQAIGAAVTR